VAIATDNSRAGQSELATARTGPHGKPDPVPEFHKRYIALRTHEPNALSAARS
jgi:hypothetical protein